MSKEPHDGSSNLTNAPRAGGQVSETATVSPDATPDPSAGESPPSKSGQTHNELPPEVRAVGAILAVDFLVGIWLALHTSGAITAYLAPQLPVVGLGGLAWGFLPDAPKKTFGAWLATRLAAPVVLGIVLMFGAAALCASMFVSTVIIASVEAGTSTTLHVLRGTPACVDAETARNSKELRLNRLTTPQRTHLSISPLGTRVWLYTSTHVSIRSPKVLPWIPVRLQYPDDFEQMVTIEVLPDDSTLAMLSHDDIRLSLRASDGSGALIAEDTLHEGSARIAFTEPAPIGHDTLARWQALLEAIQPDPDFVKPMLAAWQRTTWIAACYPLRVGQEFLYEVHSVSGKSLVKGWLKLTDVGTRLDLYL
jgi:hypothetical protein